MRAAPTALDFFCWALGMGVVVAAGAVLYNRFRGVGALGAETGPS